MTVKAFSGIHQSGKSKLSRQFNGMLRVMHPLLEEKFGREGSLQFHQQALAVFTEQIAAQIPFIGGRANLYNTDLQQTGMALALYRVVKAWGGSLETAGELINRGMMKVISRYPKFLLHIFGRWNHSKFAYPRIRKCAHLSKQRKYPADWVFDFVEGDGHTFDYGIDMLECGILKFLEQQGCPDLTPYLCAVDYITFYAMGVELQRSETLAAGCQRCNFRILVSGKPVEPTWPPQFPEREHCPA